ncbi:MAG: APC family permease [Candidatus Limnocylindrales bacterium]
MAPQQGRKPGDRRVRVETPHRRYFRYTAPGVLEAKATAEAPMTPAGRAVAALRKVVFGAPLHREAEITERLPVWKALPVFSSDVMSSVAYATEASLFTLLVAGTATFWLVMPISVLIVALLALVTFSYRQTIRAYPGGGGSYIVARANLGVLPGLVGAAALLVDYVLTVSVSVSAGILALASAFPVLQGIQVELIVVSILVVMLINLRGVRESGTIFAIPTYLFVVGALLLVAVGLAQTMLGSPPHVTGVPAAVPAVESLSLLIVLRAFADGSSAMTGTEAVANGVPAFKPPEWRNARTTMAIMASLLAVMFLGISYLALVSGAVPGANGGESVLSQVTRATFGTGAFYYLFQLATMGILVLAANTSFADFPRLSSILARDGFMPRQFAFRGERLAFNAGIVALAFVSIALVVAFNGRVEALIPLYAIGVFTAFTLSQSGMVRHWFTERGPGWRRSALINGIGATATAIVTVIFAIAKFALGAWIVIIIVPVLVGAMLLIARTYRDEARGLEVREEALISRPRRPQRVIVAAPSLNRAVVQAIKVGQTMGREVNVVHVTSSAEDGERVREQIERQIPDVPVTIVESPYRTLVRPFVRYLEVLQLEHPEEVLLVLIPEHVPRHWWERLLYNQNAHRIRQALVGRKDIVVLDVPYRREPPEDVL